jgi:catalase
VTEGGFASFAERIDAAKIRARSPSFTDHFTQTAMFFHSQAEIEQRHIVNALRFELGKCTSQAVRDRVLFMLSTEGLRKTWPPGWAWKFPKKSTAI